MKIKKQSTNLLFAFSMLLSSCASMPDWGTASGRPEVLVSGSNPQGKVISRMVAKNWTIEDQSPNHIIFQRQKLSSANRAVFAIGGDYQGILEGWNIAFIPDGSKRTRVILTSAYINTKTYGKTTNPPTKDAGEEFKATLSGL